MGHYCRICGRTRANERFSGKGHRTHVCKDCSRKPKDELEAIEQEEEIFDYLKQSNISAKNIHRLRELSTSPNARIAELAGIVLKVAEVKPHKRRRLKVLARDRPDLLEDLERTGLILAHHTDGPSLSTEELADLEAWSAEMDRDDMISGEEFFN